MQGTFTRNPRWVAFFTRVHPDPAAVRFVGRLRERYRGGVLSLHLGLTPSVLVLDPESVQHVLDNSPTSTPTRRRSGRACASSSRTP